MKKQILSIILCSLSISLFGQITFEHSYSTNGWPDEGHNSFTTENGVKYFTHDANNNIVKFYNVSHELEKTINLNVDASLHLKNIFLPSDKLFDNDTEIEFIATFEDSEWKYTMLIFNEDGEVIKDLGERYGATCIKTNDNNFKLVTTWNIEEDVSVGYDIYSLPGTLPNMTNTYYDTVLVSVTDTLIIDAVLTDVGGEENINTIKVYPNPAKTHIYIDNGNYELMNNYFIRIDNNLGQQVFMEQINQQQFYIDLSSFSGNGLYFLHIIDYNNKVIETKKILIQ